MDVLQKIPAAATVAQPPIIAEDCGEVHSQIGSTATPSTHDSDHNGLEVVVAEKMTEAKPHLVKFLTWAINGPWDVDRSADTLQNIIMHIVCDALNSADGGSRQWPPENQQDSAYANGLADQAFIKDVIDEFRTNDDRNPREDLKSTASIHRVDEISGQLNLESEEEDLRDIKDSCSGISEVPGLSNNSSTSSECTSGMSSLLSSPGSTSSGESAASPDSQTSGLDDDATVFSTGEVQNMKDSLTGFFGHFIEWKLCASNIRQHANGTAVSSSRQPLNPLKSQGTRNDKRKMQQTGDEDYQESGDQPGDDDPHGKRCKIDGMETSKIACPFLKHDYNTFIHRRTCAGPGFDGMHRMKEHLKRKHFREHGCQRCGSYFQSNRMLQEHLRAPVPCPLTEVQQEPGFITQLQWDDINHKRQGNRTNVSERWKETYLILFPDTAKASIPSPYYEPSEFPNSPPNSCKRPQYDAFLRKHLPARVLLRLEAEFQSISDQVKQRLPSIVEQELTEALKVCMRGGDLREPATPAPAIASTSSLALPVFDAGLFQGINGFDGQWQAPYGLGCGGMSDWEFGSFPQYGAEGGSW